MKKFCHRILLLFSNLSISFDVQAACPPALLTHRMMSQGREEERRRMEEEKRRGEEASLRVGERRRGEERPLYESIYSLAGSPGGICPPSNKSTLDQLHPLQLQVAPHLFCTTQLRRNVLVSSFFSHTLSPSAADGCDWGRAGAE